MSHYVSKIPREMILRSPAAKLDFAKSHPEHLVKLYHREGAGLSSPPQSIKLFRDHNNRVWKVRARDSASCPIETRDMHGRRIITNMQLDSPLLSSRGTGKEGGNMRKSTLSGCYSRDWAFTDRRTGPSFREFVSKDYQVIV